MNKLRYWFYRLHFELMATCVSLLFVILITACVDRKTVERNYWGSLAGAVADQREKPNVHRGSTP